MLYPHQQEALKWIKCTEEQPRLHEEQPRGGILAHEMGLGKTITMLTHMSSCTGINLVICPKSVLTNWLREATVKNFYSSDQVFVYYGLNRKSAELEPHVRLVLTTFDIVRTESIFKKTSLLYNITWTRIVLDEAHRIAERNSKTSKSISQLKGYNRWCLTGTPYKNGLSDIVALCKFLKIQPYSKATWWKHNAHNECSLKQWRASHLHIRHKSASFLPPITVKNCVLNSSSLEKWIQDTVRATQLPSDNKGKLQEFELLKILRMRQAAVHPLLFLPDEARQYLLQQEPCTLHGYCSACGKLAEEEKEVCVEPVLVNDEDIDLFPQLLPPCVHETINVPLEQAWSIKNGSVSLTLICERHTLCTKCSSNSLICPTCLMERYHSESSSWLHSTKTQKVLNIVQKGNKTVIFSQWTSCLDLLAQMCQHYNIPVLRYDGNVSSLEERNNVIDQFAAREDVWVLLTSLGAGAEGIDLTCATTVVLVEPSWNRAIERQAIDRVHRLGQKLPTRVYKLTMTNSIENWITELQYLKQQELDFYLNGKTPEPLTNAGKTDNTSLGKRQQRLFEKTGGGSLHTWKKTTRITTSKPAGLNMLSGFISCEL
jgi:DNA repair protein RAD5